MMRAFLFLFCLLLVHISLAQSRFSFGVDFEAGITGKKHLDRNDYRTFAEGVLTSSENGQLAGPAFSAGLWTDFQVFSFLSVRSGVSLRALQMSWYSWYDDQRPASPSANDYRYDYHLQAGYLELPTSIRLQIPLRPAAAIRPFFEFGLRPGWFVQGEWQMTLQDNFTKGKNTYVTTLHAQHHHQAFGMPYFAGVGLRFDRLAFQLTYHQERSFSHGSRRPRGLLCGVGEPLFPHNFGTNFYIDNQDWSRSLMATISYRLF